MFPAGVRHEATAAEEGSSVLERWQTGEGRSQETASSPPSSPTALLRTRSPVLAPRAHAFSTSGSQNYLPVTSDRTDEVAPPGVKIRLTASFWEDEGSLCFQVEARGVCVARRDDNHMINGTKLLSVAGIDRGRRDGILKSEKTRHVVKTGPMHLKGVWIPFERALALANKEKITELLYPLFVHNIKQLLYDPKNQKRSNLANPQHNFQETKEGAKPTESHVHQIDVPEDGDKTSQESPLDTLRNDELQEQGPIGSLSRSLIETLGLILIEVRTHSDRALHYGSLESSCAALFFWDTDLGLSRGELDDMLQDSPQLRDTCLTVLVSISQFVSTSLIHLISSEQRRKEVLQSTSILTCLDQTASMIEQQYHSTDKPEQDAETLCQTLRTRIDTLIMLAPSLESPAEENFDDEEPRAIQYIERHLPEQAYINSVSEKFPLAASAIVAQLGRLNWDRYNHMLRLQRETMQQELQMATVEKARTIFNDSGLGVSLPAQSKAVSSSESIYAPSIVSTRAEASHKRVPPIPPQARSGEPFTCEICNKQVKFQRTKAWKKHVFRDILAYACFFAECCNTRMFFEDSDALMTHLQDQHGMDVRLSDVECPLCMEFTSGDRDVLALHIARHMEEIALTILPSGVESDEESAGDSASLIGSVDSWDSLTSVFQRFDENPTNEGTGIIPVRAEDYWQCSGNDGCGFHNLPKSTTCFRCGASRDGAAAIPDYVFPSTVDTRSHFGMAPPIDAGPGAGVDQANSELQIYHLGQPIPRYMRSFTETSDAQFLASFEDPDTEDLLTPFPRLHTTIRRTPSPQFTPILERTPSSPDLSYIRQDAHSQRPTYSQFPGISFEPDASHRTQRRTQPDGVGWSDLNLQLTQNSLEGEYKDPTRGRNSDLYFEDDSSYLSVPPKRPVSPPPARAPIDSTSAYYDLSLPVYDEAPYYQADYTLQLEDSQLPPPSESSSTPYRQPNIHGLGDQPAIPSSMIPQYSFSIPPGMYSTENSSYVRSSNCDPWNPESPPPPMSPLPGDQNYLSRWQRRDPSELHETTETSSKQKLRSRDTTPFSPRGPLLHSVPTERLTYEAVRRGSPEQVRQLESDPQYNVDNLSEQPSRHRDVPYLSAGPLSYSRPPKRLTYAEAARRVWEKPRQRQLKREGNSGASFTPLVKPPWERKDDGASGTTPNSNTEYKEKLRKPK